MRDLIRLEDVIEILEGITWFHRNKNGKLVEGSRSDLESFIKFAEVEEKIQSIPAVDAVEVPQTGIGDLSDGYHTFNGLYHQRLILFAALVKAYKDRAWKSYRHEDGELCFDGGWFIVGIDTPEGSYTYHYENKDFDLFDCEELPVGKRWDGHAEDDVTRLLSLAVDAVEVRHGRWDDSSVAFYRKCSECGCCVEWDKQPFLFGIGEYNFCPNCGARMDEEEVHNGE